MKNKQQGVEKCRTGKEIFGKARKDLVIRVPKSKKREYTKALRKGGLPEYVKIVGE